jgi:hypothetical protein
MEINVFNFKHDLEERNMMESNLILTVRFLVYSLNYSDILHFSTFFVVVILLLLLASYQSPVTELQMSMHVFRTTNLRHWTRFIHIKKIKNKQAKHVLGTQGKQVYLRIQDHV